MLDPNQPILNEQQWLADLLKAPGQTEFNSLVRILTDNDVARTPGSTDQAKVGVLGSSSKKLFHGHLHQPADLHLQPDRQCGPHLKVEAETDKVEYIVS